MKSFLKSVLFPLAALMSPLHAETQVERLKLAYDFEGDSFFIPLYWIPETREFIVKQIPDHDRWVGFEMEHWRKLGAEKKQAALQEIGARFETLDPEQRHAQWKRIRLWKELSRQVNLLIGFLNEEEAFHDLAFGDPLLRPAFNGILTRRSDNFDPKHLGGSLSSGEVTGLHPILIGILMDSGEKERMECFSRLFARIAEKKKAKGE
ncbi:MAG: hypothetical protein EOP87_21695, partial [Verrucomicrobiaceae bacterium]